MRKFIVIITGLFILCTGCNPTLSYGEFSFDNISKYGVSDYLQREDFSYLRVSDVAIIPTIKAISHGTFAIDITAYSVSQNSVVTIKNVSLLHNDKEIVHTDTSIDLRLDTLSGDVYTVSERITTISENMLEAKHGEQYTLTVTCNTESDPEATIEIVYSGSVIQYRGITMP